MTVPTHLAIVDRLTGEVIGPEVGAAISVDEAAEQLPLVTAAITHLRRVEGYLRDVIAETMKAAGQVERRVPSGETYELKAEGTWAVSDEGALFAALTDACARGEITRNEQDEACQQVVIFRWHHGRLTTLARRVPRVDEYRARSEGEPRLRVKSK